jgi:hypothetical protein
MHEVIETVRIHRCKRGSVDLLHGTGMAARERDKVAVRLAKLGDTRAQTAKRFGLEIDNGHAGSFAPAMVKIA